MPNEPKLPKPPPSKYKYRRIGIYRWDTQFFPVHEIRDAVELLRFSRANPATGLFAEALVYVGEPLDLFTEPVIKFEELEGKNVKQLMRMFDDRVDAILERKRKAWYDKNYKNVRA